MSRISSDLQVLHDLQDLSGVQVLQVLQALQALKGLPGAQVPAWCEEAEHSAGKVSLMKWPLFGYQRQYVCFFFISVSLCFY